MPVTLNLNPRLLPQKRRHSLLVVVTLCLAQLFKMPLPLETWPMEIALAVTAIQNQRLLLQQFFPFLRVVVNRAPAMQMRPLLSMEPSEPAVNKRLWQVAHRASQRVRVGILHQVPRHAV